MQLSESAHLEKPVRKWSQMGKEKGTRKDVFSPIVLQCSICSILILRERALVHKPYYGVTYFQATGTTHPPDSEPLVKSHSRAILWRKAATLAPRNPNWDNYIKIASLVSQMIKNLPTIQDTWVRRPWVEKIFPALGRSPGGGHGNPFQYSCLENPMDRGTWWATVHGVAKSWTKLSN